MKQALGLVEIQGLTTAVVAADSMVKAANIRILEIENTKGLGYMTIKIAGDVGAVNAAVTAGRQIGLLHDKLVSWKVIPRPSGYVGKTFCGPEPPEPDRPKTAEANSEPEQLKLVMEEADTGAGPEKAVEEPEKAVEEPEKAVAEPEIAAEEPEKAVEEPEKAAEEPPKAVAKSDSAAVDPVIEPEPDQTPPAKTPAAKKSGTAKNKN